ncbi:cysteine--tRNA ligase [Christensenella hongkongensis]|uniref:Cysteine--tRNA ligase n=1 Tax=Christensenella hongkongensis TaxID=270498 RepID=A0A0M2NK33_9FIRM|nr:cysteine--tRNA ligase [Christensenella hongkongensis]KKI50600.1 Cysteinyl-tRNA synthetase [Christensenella hongkongensis]
MKIFNSMTGKKEELNPLTPGQFNIYACGPTVYNYVHIGNARPLIVFDTLRRYLEYRGYKVNFVQNFTDVDDKMIRVAAEEGITVKELGDRFIDEYFKDAQALNVRPATIHPKATEHIGEIIALVQKLIDKGHAYELNGDVYFDTQSFPGYGKLSGQDLSELELGARIDINESKKNPMDFALWKAQKDGEIAWDSPWGKGRPGWHIECSAMSMKYLGDTLDIHGGGQDLKFPHHENEVAQSEAATGKPFANYWMHNGYINIDNKKMSKSAGNFFTVRDILKEFRGNAVRLFMLSAHYANPINFSRELLQQSETAYDRILNCRENLKFVMANPKDNAVQVAPAIAALNEKFNAAMDDDLNTADAIGGIFEYVKEINTLFSDGGRAQDAKAAKDAMDALLDVLGILPAEESEIPNEVMELAEKRQAARAEKNWAEADRLRDEINSLGYELKDTPDGVKINQI